MWYVTQIDMYHQRKLGADDHNPSRIIAGRFTIHHNRVSDSYIPSLRREIGAELMELNFIAVEPSR
jgi:hypothetical protein